MEIGLVGRHDGVRGSRVVAAAGGDWAVAGDWELTASVGGERLAVSSRERLAGALRFAPGRLWVGGHALDLGMRGWVLLPPLLPAVTARGSSDAEVRDTAWLEPDGLAVAAARAQPPRRKGGGAWTPWERLVLLDAETRELRALLAEGPQVRRLAAEAGTLVAAGDGVRAWRDAGAEPDWLVERGTPPITALALRADGLIAAAAPAERDVILCSPEGDFRRELPGTARTGALALHPSQAIVAVGGAAGVELRSFEGDVLASAASDTPVVDLAFGDGGARLLMLAADGLVELELRDSG